MNARATLKAIESPAEVLAPPDPLAKLREPFPDHQISKLPKETKAQIAERNSDRNKGVRCQTCGSWHHKNAVHLDYVGHAALTDRLLDTDHRWMWEPVAFTADGMPAFDRSGGMWIRLTVCGVTRLGYGSADGKSGGDAVKEIIGDALRNAAMRFGAALDLWHKGDLHVPDEAEDPAKGADHQAQDESQAEAKAKAKREAVLDSAKGAIDMCGDEASVDKLISERADGLKKIKRDMPQVYDAIMEHAHERRSVLREVAADRVRKSSDAFSIAEDEIQF